MIVLSDGIEKKKSTTVVDIDEDLYLSFQNIGVPKIIKALSGQYSDAGYFYRQCPKLSPYVVWAILLFVGNRNSHWSMSDEVKDC